jgi:hypothetical protein
MADESRDVEVRLKLVVDPSGVRSVDAVTGAVHNAAAAEDTLRKNAESAAAAIRSQAAPQTAGGGPQPPRGPAATSPAPPASPNPDGYRTLAAQIAAFPGAKQQGLTPQVLAQLPPAAVADMARQLGIGGGAGDRDTYGLAPADPTREVPRPVPAPVGKPVAAEAGDAATKAGKAAADAAKEAAAAEEQYQKRLRDRIAALKEAERLRADLAKAGMGPAPVKDPTIGELADKYAQRQKQEQELRGELERRGLVKPVEPPKGPATAAERADQYAEQQQRDKAYQAELLQRGLREKSREEMSTPERVQADVRQRMESQKYQKELADALRRAGMGPTNPYDFGAAGGVLQGIGAGSLVQFAGAARAGTLGAAGYAAAGTAAALSVGQYVGEAGQIEANPYASTRSRREDQLRSFPVLGYVAGAAIDAGRTVMGAHGELGQVRYEQDRASNENQGMARVFGLDDTLGRQARDQKIRAQAFSGLELAQPQGFDKSTVLGQKLYDEEARMLPLRQQQQIAAKNRLAAEQQEAAIGRDVVALEENGKRLLQQANTARQRRIEAGNTFDPAYREVETQAAAEEKSARERLEINDKRLESKLREQMAAKDQSAVARSQERKAGIAATEGEAQNLFAREQVASSQAKSIAGLGIDGRMQAQVAFDIVKSIGVENATGSMLSQAEAAFPEELAKLKEEAGTRIIDTEGFRERAPGEYRDRLPDVRREAEEKRKQGTRDRGDDLSKFENDLAKSFDGGLEKLGDVMTSLIEKAFAKFELMMSQRQNNGAG